MVKDPFSAARTHLEDLRVLEALEDKIDLEDAKKALQDIEKQGSVSWEEIKLELAL
ncbi:MAG: hypothetical protein JSR80_03770 [Verrucomicrobia bacterium]|nr:hypothetical protein [Verrucomicrobiota bacterium]